MIKTKPEEETSGFNMIYNHKLIFKKDASPCKTATKSRHTNEVATLHTPFLDRFA